MTAIELISDAIIPLRPGDKVSTALKMMDENRISHLPVLSQDKYLGIISYDTLMACEDEAKTMASFKPAFQGISVYEGAHFFEALHALTLNKISIITVLDEDDRYLGAITREDILEAVGELLSLENPGGIIILELTQNNFSLAEIARLVESNDAKILSVGVHSLPNAPTLQVTLKLNKINLEPIIQTFRRFEYEIHSYYGKNEKDEALLQERYDALMMYLKM
jgi:CBS domain-containing protein